MRNTRRLYLPDGGSFDLETPDMRVSGPTQVAGSSDIPVVVYVVGGMAVGALLTWLWLKNR